MSWKIDWIKEVEKIIKKIDNTGYLVIDLDTVDNNISTKIKIFKTNGESKIQVIYKFDKYVDITQKYYKNDKQIFAEIIQGISPIIYKRERKIDEPYGMIIEKITYFKDKNSGVEKFRELPVFGNEDFENLKIVLSKRDFITKETTEIDYSRIEKQYDRIVKTTERY